MESSHDQTLKQPVPADDTHHDLYTIPSFSSWFSWDDIHQVERASLKEFFDGSSISRTPKIYREYRDFIISKYREESSRRLTFTEVRKSLVGDLSLLRKVFSFLERCGLINFSAPSLSTDDEDKWNVRVEEGAPNGVRVVAVPNSLKPVSVPPLLPGVRSSGDGVDNGFKLPPLSSYSDVYREFVRSKEVKCGSCKEPCHTGHYEYTKETSFVICVKCFKDENCGDNKSVDDFKLIEGIPNSGCREAVWTEAETLLLLESVLKHGDDWELVAQNVQTKSKLDCISKLIQLPFGELMLGSTHGKGRFCDLSDNISSVKQVQLPPTESQESTQTEDQCHELKNESEQNGDTENEGPPLKRVCISPISDASSSLMKQVAHICTMVGPHVTVSASEAAVTALCYENLCPREIFDGEDFVGDELGSSTQTNETERASPLVKDSERKVKNPQSETQEPSSEKNNIPEGLRMRAASATALGAAAAQAKLLADQEDREIEYLVATIIETQLKKLHCKIKHFEELELIMEKEYAQMEQLEESLLAERINVLQRVFNSGISRWRGHTVKPPTSTVL